MRATMEIDVMDEVARADQVEMPPRPVAPLSYLSTAEVAECTCPDWCERDHDRD
jgi:hypothetical protein